MLDEIPDDSISRISESFLSNVSPIEGSPKIDSAASSIEKSKSVKPEMIPPMNIPLLIAPSNQGSDVFLITSLDATGKPVEHIIFAFRLEIEEIKSSAIKGWMQNLREIDEQVRQILLSPMYQQLQEISRKGNPQSQAVSGVQSSSQTAEVSLLSALDHLQAFERIPPSAEVSETSAPKDSGQILVIPLLAASLAGIGLTQGTELIQSANPVEKVVECVENLQPLFPTVSVENFVFLINLMVVPLIYFPAWNEAISRIASKERQSYIQQTQEFAENVLKIVADPHSIFLIMQSVRKIDDLSMVDKERLARMLKVILIGVALSLLYSVEVGKVQNEEFAGIEPEELKALLLGEFSTLPDPDKASSHSEKLTARLIREAWGQLHLLSSEDRVKTLEILLNYLGTTRDLNRMLEPGKVFGDTFSNLQFNPKAKTGTFKV